jgi:hypothetical protein
MVGSHVGVERRKAQLATKYFGVSAAVLTEKLSERHNAVLRYWSESESEGQKVYLKAAILMT